MTCQAHRSERARVLACLQTRIDIRHLACHYATRRRSCSSVKEERQCPLKYSNCITMVFALVKVPKTMSKAQEFYTDLLGLQADSGRPNIPGIPGFWLYVGNDQNTAQIHLMGAEGPIAGGAQRYRRSDDTCGPGSGGHPEGQARTRSAWGLVLADSGVSRTKFRSNLCPRPLWQCH